MKKIQLVILNIEQFYCLFFIVKFCLPSKPFKIYAYFERLQILKTKLGYDLGLVKLNLSPVKPNERQIKHLAIILS